MDVWKNLQKENLVMGTTSINTDRLKCLADGGNINIYIYI